jgi:hypothetical protein
MAEYRVIVECAARGRWDDLAECARHSQVVPNEPTPPIRYDATDRRPDPRFGILDPLFPPAWVARQRAGPGEQAGPDAFAWDLRATIGQKIANPSHSDVLSDRWAERVDDVLQGDPAGPVVPPGTYARSISLYDAPPDVIAFLCGEWSPGWMPEQAFYGPTPPPDPFG